MKPLTFQQLAHIFDATLVGPPGLPVTAISTDTRTLTPGALFVALRGPTFDGHHFVADALARGAAGVLVDDAAALPASFPADRVALVLAPGLTAPIALERLAHALRQAHPGRFVAITGSVGKTTTKELLAAALVPFGEVGKTPGNFNNHLGLPLTLCSLSGTEAFVVLELGMSAPGEITRLTLVARPDVGLVTRAAPAHLAAFRDVDAIADAKAELYAALPPHARAVANADDPRLLPRARALAPTPPLTFGPADADVTVRVLAAHQGPAGLTVTLLAPAHDATPHTLTLPTVGLHVAEDVAAAATALLALDLPLAPALAAMAAHFRPAPHRMTLTTLGTVAVLDDCYNANPLATDRALATFADLFAATPHADRLALLGSMHELGPSAPALHAALGRAAAQAAQTLLATGPFAADLADAARAAGATAHAFSDFAEAAPHVTAWLTAHPNGALLLKGSRSERLERALALAPAGGR